MIMNSSCFKVNTIDRSLSINSKLRVKILLDYCRGLRGGTKSSKALLQPLSSKYSASQFSLFLYHTPRLRGLLKWLLSERANEIIGVMHMKVNIIDDCLIISGANLSHDYFTNRQDRYIVLEKCGKLCDYFEEVIDSIGAFSFYSNKTGGFFKFDLIF
jgi:CDP-diacylglycerol--glycerol-3-phosphate 3-phosphatidyltransferase